MDLRSMLNEDVDDRRSSSTHPSQTPQSRPTPTGAPLNSPYGGPRGNYQGGPNEYPFPPAHLQHQQQSSWSESRASHTPQRQQAPVLSPIKAPPPSAYASQYGHPVSTPTSSSTPGQYPPPHPYGMPSPSPSQDHFTHTHQSSPKLMRASSYHSQYGTSSQHHPITPLGAGPSHSGSQHPEQHPPSLQHQGSSASAYNTSQGIRSPKQVRPPRQSPTAAYSGHPSSYVGPDNRPRDQSASVSPKTVPLQRDLSSQPLASPRPRGNFYSYPEGYTGAKQPQYTSQPATENKPMSSGTDSPSKQLASPAPVKTKPKGNRVEMASVLSQPSSADRATFDPPRSAEAVVTPSDATPKPYPPAQGTPSTDRGDRMMLDESPMPKVEPKIEPDTQVHDVVASRPLKRRRIKAPPIWAQPGKGTTPIRGSAPQYTRRQSPSQPPSRSNGSAPPVSTPHPLPPTDGAGPLGPWEPSITNIQPFNDLTRQVANFLFNNIVLNESLPAGGAGEIPSSEGQLEIEAKIGRIIDRRTNERLRLPVHNEVVLDDTLEIAFESYMDEAQHSAYNNFLNEALVRSRAPVDPVTKKARIKMDYTHTYETDSFYELPDAEVAALPPAVQTAISSSPQGQRRKRVRVTRDQKTGRELAKIVKIRLADLHIHSPNTDFDWRISVSLEANWMGDVRTLTNAAEPDGGSTMERHKDRVSYKHLAFSIDLTQVNSDRLTHELEVELSSAEVRRQGTWAKEGRPQDYELLIQTFMDNIRILARYKKP